MNLSELRGILFNLDRAYETVETEYTQNGGMRPADKAAYFYYEGARTRERGTSAAVRCAGHGGAQHGFENDTLANALTQELTAWLWLARYSETARSMLRIDQMRAVDAAQVGAMVSYGGPGDYHVGLAASRGSVVAAPQNGGLWAGRASPEMSLRQGQARGEPWRLSFDWEGRSRDLTFSSVTKGYEEYLRATGQVVSEEALSRLGDGPAPRLIGTLFGRTRAGEAELLGGAGRLDGGRPLGELAIAAGADGLAGSRRLGEVERVPLGFAEASLSPERALAAEQLWSGPSEACQFGLGAWLDGQDELLASLEPEVRADYQKVTADWLDFLRNEGSEVRRKRKSPGQRVASTASLAVPAAVAVGAASAAGAEGSGAAASDADAGTAVQAAVATGTAGQAAIATGTAEQAATSAKAAAPKPPSVMRAEGGTAAARAGVAEAREDERGEYEGASRARESRGKVRETPQRDDGMGRRRRDRVHVRLESSAFPADDVHVREVRGKEAISRLFSFHVDIVCSAETEISVDQAIGASVSIVFEEGREEVRRLHGTIAQIDDRLETESEWRSHRLWIVPRMWRSTLVETQEVYLDTSVPDLISQKLGLVGADAEMRVIGSYPVRELIVQYKETDVAFVSRLAEHLGICFFFEHDGDDKIVFSDASSGFRPLPDCGTIAFAPRGEKVDIFEIEARSRAFPSSYAMQDYNYRTPTVDLTGMSEAAAGFAGGVVEYGAHYKTPAEGAALARLRAEERHVENRYYVGKSDVSQLSPGGTFRLSGHARLDGTEFLVVEVEHHARQTVKMQGGGGDEEAYRNTFRVVDAGLPYRPPRITPRPKIHGLLTAVVESTDTIAEAAVLDAEGRYTIKFYFDAAEIAGRIKHSRPVRMVQAHSGPSYGIHFPLKPGIEVLVAFMDGDPDRPLIVGSVPNPITPSPVVQDVNLMNRIETTSGLIIEMRDAVPPLAR